MTETFTASNGMTVERDHNNDVVIDTISVFMADGTALALREFFQHERDEELGRWRWPENPDWVGVEGEEQVGMRTVVLVNERTLERFWINYRAMDAAPDASIDKHAARAYFEDHPERRPWEDAKHGEVWAMTVGEGPEMVTYVDRQTTSFPRFIDPADDMSYGPKSGFTAGRRIWPEDAT